MAFPSNIDDVLASRLLTPIFFCKNSAFTSMLRTYMSSWLAPGIPSPGAVSGSGLLGSTCVYPLLGALPVANAPSGKKNYIGRFAASTGQLGYLHLCDRLWHNQFTANVTTLQTVNSPTWPARDDNQASNGKGVLIAVEINILTAGAGAFLTVNYTNSAGVARTGTLTNFITTGSPFGTIYTLIMPSGEQGVQSVQSIQLSASLGVANASLVAYRILTTLLSSGTNLAASIDITSGEEIEIFPGSCLFFIDASQIAVGTPTRFGTLQLLQR